MFQCYLKGGKFIESTDKNLDMVVERLDRDVLYHTSIELILDFFSAFARELARYLIEKEGIYYLATWLRRSNLKTYLDLNFGNAEVLDRFSPTENGLMLRAQPRGVVCHWVAGNVPTLSIFSLVQSILAKNVNIIRVPQSALPGTLEILKVLEQISVSRGSQSLTGLDVLKSITVVYCPSDDLPSNRELSMKADCKVIWGGKDAVRSITALEQREHCETIVFGPKYSFAVMDAESINASTLEKLTMDIITFQQEACSSPHVVFCEKQNGLHRKTAHELGLLLSKAFDRIGQKYPKPIMPYPEVFNARGLYWFDPQKEVICSEQLDWTILIDDLIRLEEPVKYRTVYVKEVDNLLDVIPLINNKIQTIGLSITDEDKKFHFCEAATRRGVARCVPFGSMNAYDTPWDGIFFMDRLVRWTSLRQEKDD